MGLFDFGSKPAKKAKKSKKSTKKTGTRKARKGKASGNPDIGMISKRASKLYRSGKSKTWAAAMRKAAKM